MKDHVLKVFYLKQIRLASHCWGKLFTIVSLSYCIVSSIMVLALVLLSSTASWLTTLYYLHALLASLLRRWAVISPVVTNITGLPIQPKSYLLLEEVAKFRMWRMNRSCCFAGVDESVCVVVAALALFFGVEDNGQRMRLDRPRTCRWLEKQKTYAGDIGDANSNNEQALKEGDAQSTEEDTSPPANLAGISIFSEEISKASVRRTLAFVTSHYPSGCPCRGNLKQVYSFLRMQWTEMFRQDLYFIIMKSLHPPMMDDGTLCIQLQLAVASSSVVSQQQTLYRPSCWVFVLKMWQV